MDVMSKRKKLSILSDRLFLFFFFAAIVLHVSCIRKLTAVKVLRVYFYFASK